MATSKALDIKYGISVNTNSFVDSSRNITSGTINKITITAPANGATLTIADSKTLTVSNTLTFTGTDATSVNFGSGGTVVYSNSNLGQFASTTSAELAGVISDETGSGALVFGTSPAFTTSVTTGSTSFDVFNTTATTVNAFGAATDLKIGAASGNTTVRNNLVVSGNLQVDGTTTIVNSTVTSLDDPILALGGDTSTVETTKDRGIEFKWGGLSLLVDNYTGNGTTTVTASHSLFFPPQELVGNTITISGATGTEQSKLNGTWKIQSNDLSTFTFTVSSIVAAGTYTTNLGNLIYSKNGFFGFDQSTQRFTFIPQSNNVSEVFSGTVGDVEIRDLYVTGGDIFSAADTTSRLFSTTTTGNVSIANGLTTGTLRIGSADGSGQVDIGNTGTAAAQAVNIATATTGTITIGGTGATAVQLPTGKTKIGTSILAQGSAFTYSLPTAAANATLAITANKLNVFAATTSAELAGVISDETGSGALVFGTSPAFTTSVTTGSTSFDVFNTTATTVNAFGAATTLALANTETTARSINIATAATAGASTLTFGGAVSGNTIQINSTAAGSINLTTDVTTGTANIFTSVTGSVNIGGVGSLIYTGTQAAIEASTTTVATVNQTATDTFPAATFRSAEYLVQIVQGSAYQISKILLVHNGTTAFITEYGTVASGSVLGTLDADISGGNVRLLVTMGSATSATVKVSRTSIVV